MSKRIYPRQDISLLNPSRKRGVRALLPDSCNRIPRQRLVRLAAFLIIPFIGLSAAHAKTEEPLNAQGRIILIRGLDREIAVAKILLPRGKHGVFVNSKGLLDETRAQEELKTNGPAIPPGMPVEITKIKFKAHEIVFEINNGGKKRGKWYEHLQIGMGGATQPVAPQHPAVADGSWITLTFHDEKVPPLSVDQVKQLLSGVLDFNQRLPTELYTPSVPKEFKEAIKKHQVLVGMDRDTVLSAKGPPDRKVREVKQDGNETEDWIYGLPPHVLFVVFNGDTVASVHQY